MRILVVSNFYPPHYFGGYELACAGAVEELRRRGHTLLVLTSDHGEAPDRPEAGNGAAGGDGVSVRRVLRAGWPFHPDDSGAERRRSLFFHAGNLRRTLEALRRFRPDVVYVWHARGVGALQILVAAKAAGTPVVVHHMDYWMTLLTRRPDGRPARGAPLLEAWLLRSLDPWVVYMSRRVEREFLERGLRFRRATVIPPGEDPSRIPRSTRGQGAGPLWRLVFASQLLFDKGLGVAIRALQRVVERHGRGDVLLDVIGEGPHDAAARALAAETRTQGYVRFLGKVPHADLLRRLARYDLLLFPTHEREPGGIIVIEAMMAGCVVLTSAWGGPVEMVDDGRTGYTLPPDPDAYAERIVALMEDPASFARVSRAAAAHARSVFAVRGVVDRIERVLEEAAGRRGAAPARGPQAA